MRPAQSPIALPTVLLAFVLALAAAPSHAQQVLKFEETKIDLGPISDDLPQIHAFKFQNVSGRRVKLSMSYCHFCAPPMLNKNVLQPSEEATVVLELDPTGKRGPYSASATIMEEGKPASHVDVELKGDICPRVWIEPTSMFPRITRGKSTTSSFSVTGRSANFRVLRVESDVPVGRFEIGEPVAIQELGGAATKQEITVHFPTDLPLGPLSANLHVVTNDSDARPKGIGISGQVSGEVDHEPTNIRFETAPGEFFRESFDITAEEAPLILHSLDITSRDECTNLALDVDRTPDPSHIRVTISGQAPSRERQLVLVNVRAVASTLSMGGMETHDVPVIFSAINPRPAQLPVQAPQAPQTPPR